MRAPQVADFCAAAWQDFTPPLTVAGTTNVGGLVGGAVAAGAVTATNAYWDINSTAQNSSYAGTGITNANAYAQATYSGLDFTNTWVMIEGQTRPMLRSEHASVIYTPHALQLMTLDLSASYTLGTNLQMTSAFTATGGYYGDVWGSSGFMSVGNNSTQFTGNFKGQSHTITGLTINRPGTNYTGLFGYTNGATIDHVTLSGGSITANDNVGALIGYMMGGSVTSAFASSALNGMSTGESNTGGLIGTVDAGTVNLSATSGSTTGAGYQIGGLVGYLRNGGTVTQSYATGKVTGTNTNSGYGYIGGLVGANGYSGDGGTISQSYATGTVTGSAGPVGGLVGHNDGAITNSYAMGTVIALGSASNVGGLVGVNYLNGTIASAYSTGYVSGGSSVGGFAGYNNNSASAITNAYWDSQTSGRSIGIAGGSGSITPRTTTQLQGTLLTGFSSAIWGTGANLYPYFGWQYSTTPVQVSGIAYSDAGASVLSGTTVTTVSNGAAIGSASSGANGYYYILTTSGSIASTGAMSYLDGASAKGAAFADTSGTNGIQNLDIYGSSIRLTTGQSTLSATRSNYSTTLGTYSDTDLSSFLSSNSFNSLTTTAGYGVYLTTSANYTLDTTLASSGLLSLTSGGTFGVSGSVGLTAAGVLSTASPINWSDTSALTLTTNSGSGIMLGGAISGTNGSLTVAAAGTVSQTNAVNVGTFSLTSGTWSQISGTLASFNANDFRLSGSATFLRASGGDGSSATPYELVDIYGIQGMASNSLLGKNFVLTADIDASGTTHWNSGAGFVPIGQTADFTGTLDGRNHSITGLVIDRASAVAGLFGTIGGGTISDLSLSGTVTGATAGLLAGYNYGTVTDVTVSGTAITGNGSGPGAINYVGGMIALNGGTLTNGRSSATVTAGDYTYAGGLVGLNAAHTSGGSIVSTGTVTGSSATGTVSSGAESAAGGLIGRNTTTISASYATGAVTGGANAHVGGLIGDNQVDGSAGTTGTVSTSFATGAATSGAGATATAGGLAGVNAGSITNTYATGNIFGGQVSGGLVGINSGTVSNSYSTGLLPGSPVIHGGLVGNNNGSVIGSFWNTTTSGVSNGAGLGSASGMTGLTTTGMSTLSNFTTASWNISASGGDGSIWRIYEGGTAPLLRTFMTALTVTGGNSTKVFDGSTTSTDTGTLTYSLTGYNSGLISGSATYTSSSANVGNYSGATLALNGLYSSQLGYDITTVVGNLAVTPRAITVTANAGTMTYGDAVPALTYALTSGSLVGADTLSGTLATSATASSGAGTYAITQGTLAASANYTLTYVGANLAVTPRAITVTANPGTMTYGDAVPTLTYALTSGSLVGADTLYGTLATSATASSGAGTYAVTQGTLAASANYTLTYVDGTLTITAAPVGPAPTVLPASTVFEQPSFIRLGQTSGASRTDLPMCPSGAVMGAACAAFPHPANQSLGQYITIGSLQ